MNVSYPWQQKQWNDIARQHTQKRLPHALLFIGNPGLGKVDCAQAIARGILCEADPHSIEACGQCRGCELFDARSHPDFYNVALLEKSKLIKVEQVRDLTHQLNQTSQRQGYQVAVIAPADQMNRASANALLKTLEEPPGQVLLILVADSLAALPPTIVSRCQKIVFQGSHNSDTLAWLRSQLSTDDPLEVLLRLSQDAPLRAAELAKMGGLEWRDQLLQHLWDVLSGEDPLKPIAAFIKLDLYIIMQLLFCIIADIVKCQQGVEMSVLVNQDRLKQIQALADKYAMTYWLAFWVKCQHVQRLLQSNQNPNLQLLFEGLFLSLCDHKRGIAC